ncbi:MAG: hypothetical protein DRI93_03370 [Aquificota bacterium]|nr:MAG: hypothetical protein DRI93_03370 [Aquificota bacterium]
MRRFVWIPLLALFLLLGCKGEMVGGTGVRESDPALVFMEKAKDLYRQGKYKEAIDELKSAMARVKARQMKAFEEVLPPPPQGWKAGEPSTAPVVPDFLGGGVKVSRMYTGPSGERVEVAILSQSPLIQSVLSLISSVSVLGQVGNTRLFLYKGEKALERFYPHDRRGELDVVVGGRALVMIKGEGISKASLLTEFLKGIKWERMVALMG